MRTNMLEYTKLILQKVSFSPVLFAKELRKSKKVLNRKERIRLLSWLKQQYDGRMTQAIKLYEYSLHRHRSHTPVHVKLAF